MSISSAHTPIFWNRAMAGKTEVLVGRVNGRFVHIPIVLVVEGRASAPMRPGPSGSRS